MHQLPWLSHSLLSKIKKILVMSWRPACKASSGKVSAYTLLEIIKMSLVKHKAGIA